MLMKPGERSGSRRVCGGCKTLVNILDCYLLFRLSHLKLILNQCCHAFEINLFTAKAARVFEMSMATIAAIGNTTVRAYNEVSTIRTE